MKYCQRCGTELNDDAAFCTKCGLQQQSIGADITKNNKKEIEIIDDNNQNQTRQEEIKKSKVSKLVKGIISLALGVSGIIASLIGWFLIGGLPFGIYEMAGGVVGIVLGGNCLNKTSGNGFGKAGFVLSIINSVSGLILVCVMINYLA